MTIKQWPIPASVKAWTTEQLSDYLFRRADEAGRDNMGMPDLLLAEAAHRLLKLETKS